MVCKNCPGHKGICHRICDCVETVGVSQALMTVDKTYSGITTARKPPTSKCRKFEKGLCGVCPGMSDSGEIGGRQWRDLKHKVMNDL